MTLDNQSIPVDQWPSVFDRATSTTYTQSDWDGSAAFEIPNTSCNRTRWVDQAWLDLKAVATVPATLRIVRKTAAQTIAAAMSAGQYLNAAVSLNTAALAGVQTTIALDKTSTHRKLDPGDTLWIVNPSTTAASGGLDGLRVGVALRDVQW